jgi:hypothetical protein
MVCPRNGQFFAIEASDSDSATFQAFLDEANKTVITQKRLKKLPVSERYYDKRSNTTDPEI